MHPQGPVQHTDSQPQLPSNTGGSFCCAFMSCSFLMAANLELVIVSIQRMATCDKKGGVSWVMDKSPTGAIATLPSFATFHLFVACAFVLCLLVIDIDMVMVWVYFWFGGSAH